MTTVSLIRPTRDCDPRLADLDAERATYHVEVPTRFNAVLDIVDVWASEDPDALAVLSRRRGGATLSRQQSAADLARASREAARVLLDHGVGKGDHVFVMLPRIPEWYAALLGAMRIGAIPMPGPESADSEGHRVPLRCRPARPRRSPMRPARARSTRPVPGLRRGSASEARPLAGSRWRSGAARSEMARRRSTRPIATIRCFCTSRAAPCRLPEDGPALAVLRARAYRHRALLAGPAPG